MQSKDLKVLQHDIRKHERKMYHAFKSMCKYKVLKYSYWQKIKSKNDNGNKKIKKHEITTCKPKINIFNKIECNVSK